MNEQIEIKKYERDERGLKKSVQYKFKENGRVDWRAMVNHDYVIFNPQKTKQIEEKYGKPIDQLKTVDAEDCDLMILLQGIKDLAELRGILEYDPQVVYVADNHATVKAKIVWIPNFETDGMPIAFGGVGGATLENTNGFGQLYLESIAENRAFVRAVRNFLGINIVGRDEVGGKAVILNAQDATSKTSAFSSNALLEQRCKEKNISFETFKEGVIKKYSDKVPSGTDIVSWKSFADLRPIDATNFLDVIKESGIK